MFPAELVSALVPVLKTVSLHGGIDIDAPSIAWRAGIVTGNVAANWRAAQVAVAGSGAVDLGDVSISGAPDGDGIAARVRNRGGDVAIEGTLVSRNGPIDVSLTLTPTRRASDALRTALSLLGPATDAGGVRLAWHGSP